MSAHVGLARMEAASWAPPRITLPELPRAARWALWGRLAVCTAVCLVLAVLATFHQPGFTTTGKAHVHFDQMTTIEGEPVSRTAWEDRAWGLYMNERYCETNPQRCG